MWKFLSLIISFLLVGLAQSQQTIEVECLFGNLWGYYACQLDEIEVLDPTATVVFTGEHTGTNTNENVRILVTWDSNTPFILEDAFTTFPNLTDYEVYYSNLQSIRIPPHANLMEFWANGNNISVIHANSFENQTQLTYVNLYNNQIQEIEDGAFDDCSSLRSASFINNQIQQLTTRTLSGLVNAYYIDFERNALTRIEEGVFSNNHELTSLYLEYNQINEVSPNFVREVTGNRLSFINFSGNQCVRTFISIDQTVGKQVLAAALQPCFRNFEGIGADERRETSVQYTGSISIFDQFGNELISL